MGFVDPEVLDEMKKAYVGLFNNMIEKAKENGSASHQ